MKPTQHKSALIQALCSILWFLNVFGMNTNGSNRNGSMKRRLPNSIFVNNFIDLFVRASLSGVSPRDEQGKTESSELVLQKSKSPVKVSRFLFNSPPKQLQDSAAAAGQRSVCVCVGEPLEPRAHRGDYTLCAASLAIFAFRALDFSE